MIKNLIFDIGNVILNFDINRVLNNITDSEEEKEFIMNNIYHSPEWAMYNIIDTGLLDLESCIKLQCDRTDNVNDELIRRFWTTYNNYAFLDKRVIDLISKLKNNYNIYLLSNMDDNNFKIIRESNLLNIVDGYVVSYEVNQVKPHVGIYNTLLNKYNLNPSECVFIDDNKNNILTGERLGIKGINVVPDNYESIIEELINNNIMEG